MKLTPIYLFDQFSGDLGFIKVCRLDFVYTVV